MDVARRLYLYSAAAVGLIALAMGVVRLASIVLVEATGGRGLVITASGLGSDVSLGIALVAVGLPIWLLHWTVAQRARVGDSDAALAERHSTVRAAYLAAVQMGAYIVTLSSAVAVVSGALSMAAGTPVATTTERGDAVASLLVAAAIWLGHARLQVCELRRSQLHGAAAWLPRLARYAGAGLALTLAFIGVGQAIQTVLDAGATGVTVGVTGDIGVRALAGPGALIAVGVLGWWSRWSEAGSLIRDRERTGEDERRTYLRAAYFAAAQLGAAISAALAIALVLFALLRGGAPVRAIVEPILLALPVAVAGFWHVRAQMVEGDEVDREQAQQLDPRLRSDVERRVLLIVSIAGLTFLASGAGWLLAFLLDAVSAPTGIVIADDAAADLLAAGPISLLIAGAALWLPSWWLVSRRRAASPLPEARSTARAVYLYVVLFASLAILVPDAAILVYRSLDQVLRAAAATPLLPDQAGVIAVLAVGLPIVGYHGWLLREDRRLARREGRPAEAADVAAVAGTTTVRLVLRLPVGADVDATLSRLGSVLEAGMTIEAERTRRTLAGSTSADTDSPVRPISPPELPAT